jgi:hypothetical protein
MKKVIAERAFGDTQDMKDTGHEEHAQKYKPFSVNHNPNL